VPDGLKICKVLVEAENGLRTSIPDGWTMLNPKGSPFLWVNGRIFYGARKDYPSWHKALFTPKYLLEVYSSVGFVEVQQMDRSEVRGYDHGWINLGVRGQKP